MLGGAYACFSFWRHATLTCPIPVLASDTGQFNFTSHQITKKTLFSRTHSYSISSVDVAAVDMALEVTSGLESFADDLEEESSRLHSFLLCEAWRDCGIL